MSLLLKLLVFAGALPSNLPSQGQGELPEAAEDVRPQQAASPAAQEPEAEELVQGAEGHQVLPDDHSGLGGSWPAGMNPIHCLPSFLLSKCLRTVHQQVNLTHTAFKCDSQQSNEFTHAQACYLLVPCSGYVA